MTIAVLTFLAAPVLGQPAPREGEGPAGARGNDEPSFAERVDLTAFGRLAVHSRGRVKSFDSFAASVMRAVTGSRSIDGQSDAFTYLDLMLRPGRYEDEDHIYVKNKLVRAAIAQTLAEPGIDAALSERLERFVKRGLISPSLLRAERVQAILARLSTDLMRSARYVDAVRNALAVRDASNLRQGLKLVAPPGGGAEERWYTLDELAMAGDTRPDLAAMPAELRQKLISAWIDFTNAWRRSDAVGVNATSAQLAALLPAVSPDPEVYPEHSRLAWESWYFRHGNMTWIWLIYAFSLVPLLLFVSFRWSAARWAGLLLFFAAFGFHTFAVMLRWYVSGRWPNANMFEAVTTAAWFGACFAVLFELFAQRSPMRGLFALGSAVASMTALMATKFYPLQLDPTIGNIMPVLHDVWLYIHTNVIIFSYALIFMAAVSALLYLVYRAGRSLRGADGTGEFARVGGAGSLIMTAPEGSSPLERARTTIGQVLDGTTMILIELSFILLWAGIVMGAIWADHSWGRPWGWDPKEVFALNTFIVFALLIHVRLQARDKGLWTAILAVIGCAVMLFNWIVINFTIAGLHSYA
ncbi:MAG: cytochrome c biogenesis protein CcsA [Planctomycetota bacterium]|nr:cytochrome c biogenesis protein CcsA [Planctomycetota bacterium]